MTNAARLLNVSQPSVSKVLAHAEQQLGYPLFDRTRGKLVATPEADRLFGLVSNVFDDVEQLRHVAENLRASDTGKVRIAATPAFGVDLIPAAISSYLEQRPETEFEIETLHHDEIGDALLESRVDIGLAFAAVPPPGLVKESMAHAEFFVIASPDIDFGDNERVSVDMLTSFPFISLSGRGPLGRMLSSHLENHNAELNKTVFTETYQVAKALVARGAGVSVVDAVTALSSDFSDVQHKLLDPPLQYSIDVLSSDAMPLSIVGHRFVQHLKSVTQKFLVCPTVIGTA